MFQNKVMSISDWFFFIVLMWIPIINLIVYILLLANPNTNPSLKNLLWLGVILIVVGAFAWVSLFGVIISRFI